jgi:hypothetical protein
MTEKPKQIPSVAACRAAQGRAPNGVPLDPAARFARTPINSKTAELEEVERLVRHLLTLPPEDRAAAALKAFPPSYVAGAPSAAAFDKELEAMSITELTNLIGDLKSKRAAAAIDVRHQAKAWSNTKTTMRHRPRMTDRGNRTETPQRSRLSVVGPCRGWPAQGHCCARRRRWRAY